MIEFLLFLMIFALGLSLRRAFVRIGYLERELTAHPLQAFPLNGDELLAIVASIAETGDSAPQQRLFAVLDAVARQAGCAGVIASWGEKYEWMQQMR